MTFNLTLMRDLKPGDTFMLMEKGYTMLHGLKAENYLPPRVVTESLTVERIVNDVLHARVSCFREGYHNETFLLLNR